MKQMPSTIEKKISQVKDAIKRNRSSVGSMKAAAFLQDLNDIEHFVQQHAKTIRTFPMARLRLDKVKEMLGMYKPEVAPDKEN